jgi:putative flavoprotein involved in K+ transport
VDERIAACRDGTVVIGGSQSGLAVSYWLARENHPHIILERDRIGASWRDKRWDSFCLVTPNWMLRLPGYPYQGNHPDGFLQGDDIVKYLTDYAAFFNPPLLEELAVERLSKTNSHYDVVTTIKAHSVVVCVGYFHEPRLPEAAANIDSSIFTNS